MQLKRASVAAEWELVGGARSLDELEGQIRTWSPQVIVLDALLGPDAVQLANRLAPASRVVIVGEAPGVQQDVAWLEDVRSAILGVPGRSGSPSP